MEITTARDGKNKSSAEFREIGYIIFFLFRDSVYLFMLCKANALAVLRYIHTQHTTQCELSYRGLRPLKQGVTYVPDKRPKWVKTPK